MWDFLGSALGGWFGYKGTKDQNVASAAQADKAMAFSKAAQQKQMDFQERMSGSAHQRQMADMRKAGLNPILSAKYGGATSPAGSSAAGVAAPQYNKAQVALQNATTAANVENIMANTAKTREETRKIAFKADISDAGSNIIDYVLDQTERGMTNARDIAENYFARENWFNPENYSFIEQLIPRKENAIRNIALGGPRGKRHLKAKFREMPLPGSHHPVSKSLKAQAKRNFLANYQTTIRQKRRNK